MEENISRLNQAKMNTTAKALKNHFFDVVLLQKKEEVIPYLKNQMHEVSVGVGGSVTLDECGVIEWLRKEPSLRFIDRYQWEDKKKALRDSLLADVFLTSCNAVTMDGMLYNVDGNGNRVAAITYGPDKVYAICGVNKIVRDISEAKQRVETISAPANCLRLNKDNPCTALGACVHCNKEGSTICSSYLITRRCAIKNRITVILVNEELGY